MNAPAALAGTGYSGRLLTRDHLPGEWVLLVALVYTTLAGMKVIAPGGFVTDLASIPPFLRWLFSPNDATRRPAVTHDWLYCAQLTTRLVADRIFLEALERNGVGYLRRKAMYAGVRVGGWWYWNKRAGRGVAADDFAAIDG